MKFFRKIVIGISTIAFTTVALTSTTYAWFKINSRASVTGMNFKLTGGLGFYVSVDGVNYSNDLTADDIYMAMIAKYKSDEYVVRFDEETKMSGLFGYTSEKNENGETVINYDTSPQTYDEIINLVKGIELQPLTSNDGKEIKNQFGHNENSKFGRYYEFDVYFKTVSQTGMRRATQYVENGEYYESDGSGGYIPVVGVNESTFSNYFIDCGEELQYDIYLNGDTIWKDPTTGRETSVSPTSFISDSEPEVELSANMTAVVGGEIKNLSFGDKLKVYTANALRLSITDNYAYDVSAGGAQNTIVYELNDYQHSSSNLGSYATKYDRDYCDDNSIAYTDQDELLYNYQNNASYTYYSNLKNTSQLFDKMYDFKEDIPSHTLKYSDLLRDDDNEYKNNKVITTLSSNSISPTRLTFRIWLEGWDADCFDGIKGNIKALLSFVAVPHKS